jgi:hypothetical protein
MADYGSRPVTKRDRDLAVKRELLRTTSPIHLTAGMIRHLRGLKVTRSAPGPHQCTGSHLPAGSPDAGGQG